jgi:phage head maturation protease
MRFYWPIAKVDGEQRMVWGYASTEALDDQGERVTREALAAALDGYMRFANIREMHRNSAVGVAKEAEIDDRGLYLGAKIVDDDAWRKVVEGVYNGFSIGGRVTARDPSDRTLITGLALTEISVVDRPANPEAVFDCWKLAAGANAIDRDAPAVERLCAIVEQLCGLVAPLVTPPVAKGSASPPAQPDPAALAAGLAKLAEAIVPRLDALQKRVEDIAATPLPPQAAARGFGFPGVSKREDGGGVLISGDDIAAALARMTDEERTLTLIKAAHAHPIAPFARD